MSVQANSTSSGKNFDIGFSATYRPTVYFSILSSSQTESEEGVE